MAHPFTPRWGLPAVLALAASWALPPAYAEAAARASASPPAPATAWPDRAPDFIYPRVCGYCHGHNVGPIIRGRKLAPETIEHVVRNGNGAMPAFKPTEITNSELKALARWISAAPADPREKGQ